MSRSGTGHQTGCRPAGALMKVERCADILQGDLGEFWAPSAPDSLVRASVLILTGSSRVLNCCSIRFPICEEKEETHPKMLSFNKIFKASN